MENQKTVELISFELKDYRIIKAVKLDFERWKDENVLEVVGDVGNGKSSLLEGLSMATTGTAHIKDKDLLDMGFKSEVQLADGDHRIFLGVKVSETKKGVKKGEAKFETYIYEKDINDKLINNPVIDGAKATAKEYTDLLSTALTFRMDSMFSENQTIHRNLITELFAKELNDLGVDELLESIKQKKSDRDNVRYDCERQSAFMEHFKSEGYSESKLEQLVRLPIESTLEEIEALKVDRGVLVQNPEKDKDNKLAKIRENGRELVEKVREINEEKTSDYKIKLDNHQGLVKNMEDDLAPVKSLEAELINYNLAMPESIKSSFQSILEKWANEIKLNHKDAVKSVAPIPPETISIVSGKMEVPDMVPADYTKLIESYQDLLAKYKKESEKETFYPDTSEIDTKIKQKESEIKVAEHNNALVDRFELWKKWIEAKGVYEKEVDVLRKLYTKIDTGVDGLSITPHILDSGKLEIWMEYNGVHDATLFQNKEKEYRRLYEYSKSQRAITGVLLQAARLDKKPKALRLCVLDDYTQTKKGKILLGKICKEHNLKLVISKTSDEYDLKALGDATFAMENGELLLGGQNGG